MHVVIGCGVQHLEADTIPLPALTGRATTLAHSPALCVDPQRMQAFDRAGQFANRHALQQRRGTAHVIRIAVTQHQRIDAVIAA